MVLVGYSNVDWVGNLNECKSTSKYTFLLNNGDISWRRKKQTYPTLSTMEAKFIRFSYSTGSCVVEKIFIESRNSHKCFLANDSL